jgi:hypothetical protein
MMEFVSEGQAALYSPLSTPMAKTLVGIKGVFLRTLGHQLVKGKFSLKLLFNLMLLALCRRLPGRNPLGFKMDQTVTQPDKQSNILIRLLSGVERVLPG